MTVRAMKIKNIDFENMLDLSRLPPSQRHSLIFVSLEILKPGQTLVFANDHDPKLFYFELQRKYNHHLIWKHIKSGSEKWGSRRDTYPSWEI